MARKTKKEVEQQTINIKYEPMNIRGDTAFKCVNDDWGVVAFDIRRAQLEDSRIQFGDKELQYNCIYFLIGWDELTEKIYVGQAKKRNSNGSVLNRLREHAKSTSEPYADIWTRAIVVTGKDDTWGPTELNALEHIFYSRVTSKNRLNGNNPNAGIDNLEQYKDKVNQIELYLATLCVAQFIGTDESEKVTVQSITNDYSTVEDLQNGMARIPEIVTPKRVVKSIVDLLPDEVWNENTKFLDPACKGGEFLREIYDRLMETESLKAKYPNEFARANHILSEQIYGIALSEVSKKRTTDTLNGFGYNIKIIPYYINLLKSKNLGSKEDGTQETIRDVISEEFDGIMKFDVVIGNPPYQEMTGGGRAVAIFDKFIELGINVGNISTLITPSRWLTDTKYSRLREIALKHMTNVVIFKDCKTVFNGISCGSVSYYLVNTGKISDVIDIHSVESNIRYSIPSVLGMIPLDEYAIAISNKCVDEKDAFKFVGRRIFGVSPRWSDGAPLLDIYSKNTNFNFICYENGCFNIERCSKDALNNVGYADYYRLIVASNLNMNKTVIGAMTIASPGSASDFNIATLYYSTNKGECYNCGKYVKTKFVRYLILITLSKTQVSISKDRLRYVPAQNFTSNSDIDWSKSIAEIDQQLYKKYNLTQEEIDYIEKTIKPME